ncbi:trypsin alpha-3-like [Anopheles bellator]|uniref:trypsin alpha-3-like n=1 Tax=Anopheles bellator TaxID=139047 RepID=UPI00264948F3|nr:trypsin alpha-3-like [Anopheles bellator]
MKGVAYILLALAIAGHAVAGYRLQDEEDEFVPFIASGTNAVLGQFASVVAVGLPAPPTNAFCGGVILNENHVLTAAICVLTPQHTLLETSAVTILSGALQLNFAADRIGISAMYVHPQYNPYTLENNVAVLRTNTSFLFPVVPVPSLEVATIYEEVMFDGQACQVVGWANGTATPVQQFINTPILNRDTCNELVVNFGRVQDSMVCAGTTGTGPGVCASNQGTGLFCEGRLAGILVTGLGCGQANNPGIYAQLRYYLPWIREQFTRQDIPVAGSSPIPAL